MNADDEETNDPENPTPGDPITPEEPVKPAPEPLGTCAPEHGYLFCEDFESLPAGVPNSPNWTIVKGGSGNAVIDSVQKRGTKALHLTASPGYGNRSVLRREHETIGNSFWARVWIYVEQWPTGRPGAHYTVMQLDPYAIRPFDGQFFEDTPFLSIGADNASGDWNTWNVMPRVAASSGRWMCLETEVDASRNSVSLWVDGEEKPQSGISQNDHPGSGELIFPEFTSMDIGWTLYQGDAEPTTFELWLDDIVVHTEQVGCDEAMP
jgi:hypothetical protein